MDTIHILDKDFKVSITNEVLNEKIKAVAEVLNKDYEGKSPVMIGILNGAFMFTAELAKYLTFQPEIIFARFSSYNGMETTGKVKELMGVTADLVGRDVILVEDVVDTGITMKQVKPQIEAMGAESVKIACMLQKPEKLQVDLTVDYCAMEIENDFIVGFGLDYNGLGRQYKDIYKVIHNA